MPRPPSWIRMRITICPKKEKQAPVSTTVSPVTQTAEVDVKRASMKEISPDVVEKGSMRRNAPASIAAIKLNIRKEAGLNLLNLFNMRLLIKDINDIKV